MVRNLKCFVSFFEEAACGVLKIFDEKEAEFKNGFLLLQKVPFYDLDCFELATLGDINDEICLKFFSKKSVKNLIEKLWLGGWCTESSIKSNGAISNKMKNLLKVKFFLKI